MLQHPQTRNMRADDAAGGRSLSDSSDVFDPPKQPQTTNRVRFIGDSSVKDRGHCFSMQFVTNKCFLLNPEKKFNAYPSCCFREKRKHRSFNSKK